MLSKNKCKSSFLIEQGHFAYIQRQNVFFKKKIKKIGLHILKK